jgi:hypothetical protein
MARGDGRMVSPAAAAKMIDYSNIFVTIIFGCLSFAATLTKPAKTLRQVVRRAGRSCGRQGGDSSHADGAGEPVQHQGRRRGHVEYKIDFGPGYRIYFGKDGERLVILIGGGTKKRQDNDIAAAQECWADYKRRKKHARYP